MIRIQTIPFVSKQHVPLHDDVRIRSHMIWACLYAHIQPRLLLLGCEGDGVETIATAMAEFVKKKIAEKLAK